VRSRADADPRCHRSMGCGAPPAMD